MTAINLRDYSPGSTKHKQPDCRMHAITHNG